VATEEEASAVAALLRKKLRGTRIRFEVEENFERPGHFYIAMNAELGGTPPDLSAHIPSGWYATRWRCEDQRAYIASVLEF